MPPIRSNPSSAVDIEAAHDENLAAIAPERVADAIRYAVLGIVAVGLRHSIAGQLQAIQASAEVSATMLDRGGDRATVARNLARIPNLCKSTGTRLGMFVEWLAMSP
jgi:C4-dicarboxylate-specific signal transduction histidine kinase